MSMICFLELKFAIPLSYQHVCNITCCFITLFYQREFYLVPCHKLEFTNASNDFLSTSFNILTIVVWKVKLKKKNLVFNQEICILEAEDAFVSELSFGSLSHMPKKVGLSLWHPYRGLCIAFDNLPQVSMRSTCRLIRYRTRNLPSHVLRKVARASADMLGDGKFLVRR